MTSSNKKPANWPEALAMADSVEETCLMALQRILRLVGSDKMAAVESEYEGLVLTDPARIRDEIMGRELRIREAIRLLELREVDRALEALRS